MPIRPENRHYYAGPEWKAIRAEILERAKNCCERCKAPNEGIMRTDSWQLSPDVAPMPVYLIIGEEKIRSSETGEVVAHLSGYSDTLVMLNDLVAEGWRPIKVILTIAHLDHDPGNNSRNNLQALCQRCHNRYDVSHRAETRKTSRKILPMTPPKTA